MALKLYKQCPFCGKQRLFWTVYHRQVPIPTMKDTARSKKAMCNKCYTNVIKMLNLK